MKGITLSFILIQQILLAQEYNIDNFKYSEPEKINYAKDKVSNDLMFNIKFDFKYNDIDFNNTSSIEKETKRNAINIKEIQNELLTFKLTGIYFQIHLMF